MDVLFFHSENEYKDQNFKQQISYYEPWFYHDVKINQRDYHLAVKDSSTGKIYFAFDITEVERQEHLLVAILVLGVIGVLLFSIWVWYWLSIRVTRPIKQLADRIRSFEPNGKYESLVPILQDSELEIIASTLDGYPYRLQGFIDHERSFTSYVSHELRTPLTAISSLLDLFEIKEPISSLEKKYFLTVFERTFATWRF